jgi:GDP-mannose 6-dehydrogenase
MDGLADLLVDSVDDLLAWAEMVVITSHATPYSAVFSKLDTRHVIIDLNGKGTSV